MICNIVDHRINSYNVEVDVVVEPAWHDNVMDGASQFECDGEEEFNYEWLENVTVEEAVEYCNNSYLADLPVTLYLYDLNNCEFPLTMSGELYFDDQEGC